MNPTHDKRAIKVKAKFRIPNSELRERSDDDEMYLQAIITVFSHRRTMIYIPKIKKYKVSYHPLLQMEHTQFEIFYILIFSGFRLLLQHFWVFGTTLKKNV